MIFHDVEDRIRKKNKIYFRKDSPCLEDLSRLILDTDRRVLILWALDCAGETLRRFEEKYPEEGRLRRCLETCESWARGEVKMPVAKRAILDDHAVAKEIGDPAYGALCHAIGHAGATVHTPQHAMGLPLYELTAVVLGCGGAGYEEKVIDQIHWYEDRLLYWRTHADEVHREWAPFLK